MVTDSPMTETTWAARVSVAPSVEALMELAAQRVATLAAQATARHGHFRWALAGGSTPRQLYLRLAQAPYRTQIAWDKVEFFWGDERCVPPDHPESNYRMARETLLDSIAAKPGQVWRICGEAVPEHAAFTYETTLRTRFTPSEAGLSSFDLVLLGMGSDGHTASLFPDSAALHESRRWVMVSSPTASTQTRITLTPPLINSAEAVLFLVAGDSKAACLRRVLQCPTDLLPAQRIRPTHGRLEWLVDAAAAAQLESPS